MERISKAIELAKSEGAALGIADPHVRRPIPLAEPSNTASHAALSVEILSEAHLEASRIVAHQSSNPMTPAFDVLRTSLLQEMDSHGWQTLVISSPSQGCGKTVLAINLALSMARVPGRQIVLFDLDLRRPQVAAYLGLKREKSLLQLLSNATTLNDYMTNISVASAQLRVIPNRMPISNPAEVIGSTEMKALLSRLKSDPRKPIVIIDTPPMLACDDVLALLPQIDCLILAIAERISTAAEVSACERLLKSTNYLGLALTKSEERTENYYY